MRLFTLFALAAAANAQYFSEGWKPGQKVEETATAVTGYFDPYETAEASPTGADAPPPPERTPFSFASLFDVNKVLSSGPVASLFNKAGINITERLQNAEEAKARLWDDRIPLITDENFNEIIVNEPLTPQEEEDRVWVLVITISSSSREESISKLVDKMVDSAFDKSVTAGDLPNVRWGRINYLSVTAITTKWAVWRAPYLVLLRKRGKSLRFYSPYSIRVNDDVLREFLLTEGWRAEKPWSTSFAPGGDNEYIMDFTAKWMTKLYNLFVVVPNWILLAGSTMFASFLISLLHRSSAKKEEAKKVEAAKAKASAPAVKKQPSAGPSNPAPVASTSATDIPAAPAASIPKKKQKKNLAASATTLTTDSEQESAASPSKRSTRQRRAKK